MTLEQLKSFLASLPPDLPGDTPIIRHWNCAGLAEMRLRLTTLKEESSIFPAHPALVAEYEPHPKIKGWVKECSLE